jgi:fibronectin-binding autotransporter adhesin
MCSAAAGTLTISGGAFNLGAFSNTLATVTLSSGTISGTTGALTATALNLQSGTVSAIIAGASALTKTTSGTVTLTGTNTYTGATTVSQGILNLESATGPGHGGGDE